MFLYLPLSPESGHSSGEHVQLDQATARLHCPPGPQSKFIPLTNNKQMCVIVTNLKCSRGRQTSKESQHLYFLYPFITVQPDVQQFEGV